MPKISIVINTDTRNGFLESTTHFTDMLQGCRSTDFLLSGVQNKINFFNGFDIETIVFIDEHLPMPNLLLSELRKLSDSVVIRKHTNESKFNDLNYLNALSMARGDLVVHFDQDTACFTSSPSHIDYLISLLDKYAYVSYPSAWSPVAVKDPSFDHMWVSTRFFMCKKSSLDFTEIEKCLTWVSLVILMFIILVLRWTNTLYFVGIII